jgi:transitional endoplasmic reticulum ATPase
VVPLVIRPYEPNDLAQIVDLWQRTGSLPVGADGLALDGAIDAISAAPALTLVAEAEDGLVGVAVGGVTAARGWVHRLTVAPGDPRADEVGRRLLQELEQRLAASGARRVGALVRDHPAQRGALEEGDYAVTPDMLYLEHELPASNAATPAALADLGAVLVPPGLWDELKGLEDAKVIIERRVILPLAEPELARRHSVAPPKAIVLFGPPGTGKTTFAKGIASRLAWPFVEIEASELGGDGLEGQAKRLAESFDRVSEELASAVVFFDEVEDLAAARGAERKVSPSVTNEFLKQIPRMRALPEHLLVCATNWVSALDPAFLRPGRFDYVLPVGPPDAQARRAIWGRYVEEITDEPVDLEALVEASELFTPADIEFAARKAAQRAFEREHFEQEDHRATTGEFLASIHGTRRTLSQETVDAFGDDVERFARY